VLSPYKNQHCLTVENVSKFYPKNKSKRLADSEIKKAIFKTLLGRKEKNIDLDEQFSALKDISFKVKQSESLGIIGLNGSGKSTLVQIIAGTMQPTIGKVDVNGKVAALLELGSGFNPDFTGKENVIINGKILGLTDSEIRSKMQDIKDFADIGDYFDLPVRTYSSGMVLRVAFAVIVHVSPDILVIDEALAVGDARFQLKCFDVLENFKRIGRSLILVSHDMNSIARLCETSILLHEGKLICHGKSIDIINNYSKVISEKLNQRTIEKKEEPRVEIQAEYENKKEGNPEVFSYGGELGEINSISINNSDTALICAGQEFEISFNVIAYKKIENPIFALRIRDSRGQESFGTNTRFLEKHVDYMEKGEKLKVKFTQKANLGAGKYFISIGFTFYENNELKVVHRIRECIEFQVFNNDGSFGYSNCFSTVKINKIV